MVYTKPSIIAVALTLLTSASGHTTSRLAVNETTALRTISGMDEQGKITTAALVAQSERRLGSTDGTVVNGICVDYTAEGYFPSRGAPLSAVPAGFVARPSTISTCELENLHQECVARVNMYRSGQLKFTDGSSDSNALAGLSPLKEMTGNNQCSSHQTLGDHVRAQPFGFGCAGAHFTAFSCASGAQAQNSCCSWFKETTYNGVKQRLFDCLQSMWDEGITPGQKGHWETMRSTTYAYASCGFAWDENGQLSMNQDFFRGEVSGQCSCKDKKPGESDACGGKCVACSEPVVEPCNNCPVLQPTCPSGPIQTTTSTTLTMTTTTSTIIPTFLFRLRGKTEVVFAAMESECTGCDQCDWSGADTQGQKSLGGGGHSADDCKLACIDSPSCMYAARSIRGYCHYFDTCTPGHGTGWTRWRKIVQAVDLVNVVTDGSTFIKSGGGCAYNAYATWEATSICVTAGQTTKHVRVGVTTNSTDDHRYPNGKYIGLFPNGRLFNPSGSDSSYTSSDVICIGVDGFDIVAYRNNAKLETWTGSVVGNKIHVKLFFYGDGGKITMQNSVEGGRRLAEGATEIRSEQVPDMGVNNIILV